ncbi:MAG: hypothetical protein KDD02_05685 [Phaeodactylibacter sp.]|nr:hypothetical protein [Phaeodactylibacter sp.]MCB9299937.1 hypothetical protein [Lewinellaceae bacterium]
MTPTIIESIVNESFQYYENVSEAFRLKLIDDIQETHQWYNQRRGVHPIDELITEIDQYISNYRKVFEESIHPNMNWFDVGNLSGIEQKERKLLECEANIKFLEQLEKELLSDKKGDLHVTKKWKRYENTRWNKVIQDWKGILNKGISDYVIHGGRSTYSVTTQEIEKEALKYYDHYKERFKQKLEFELDALNAFEEEYYHQTRAFTSTKEGFLNVITVHQNELVFKRNFQGGDVSFRAINPVTGEESYLKNTGVSSLFDWDDFIKRTKNYDRSINFNGHELVANIVGKAYYCSYLKKRITELEKTMAPEKEPRKKTKARIIKEINFLHFFNNDANRMNKFFGVLKDLQFIDEGKNFTYPGNIRDIAILFKALIDLRDKEGKPLVRTTLNRKAMSRMLLSEIRGLNDPYETLKKAFSSTDSQRVEVTEEIYIDFLQELEKKLI